MMDPRTPSWALHSMSYEGKKGAYLSWPSLPSSWPMVAINASDLGFLQAIHELTQEVGPEGLPHYANYSFEVARVGAIRVGRLDMLQWLLENVEVPIEPTLFCEAIISHQREIAEWLATNCADACQQFDDSITLTTAWNTSCGFDEDMLTWIEGHESVRRYVDFGVMATYAVELGDVDGVRRMYESYPDAFMSRDDLWSLTTTQQLSVRKYLREIAYPRLCIDE